MMQRLILLTGALFLVAGCGSPKKPGRGDGGAFEWPDGDVGDPPDLSMPCEGTLKCRQVSCGEGVTTTLSGKVYIPSGKLPLYNAIVYVPDAPLEPFKPGVTCDKCGAIASGKPIVTALTGADGSFVLENVPAGTNVPLVLQVGRWRRRVIIPEVIPCANNVLKDVDLQVGSGEFVAIIGKSGSGKSTLINMITGIDRPTRGEVVVARTPVHTLSEGKLAEWRGRNVGVIFQFFQLLPTLTVLENLMLPMDFCNTYNRRERKTRAMQLLERVELVDQAYKLPSALSGGQQQRVAIARALANDPPLLVADEPTGNLDSKTADSVFQLFEQLVSQGKTIVMVTHDRDLAQRVTRTVIIADGQIIEEYLARTFPGLTEQQLVRVTRQVSRQTFAPGETIIHAGAPPENFYMITDGEVEVHLRTPNGEEFIMARRGKGQYIGEIELLRGGNSIATVAGAPLPSPDALVDFDVVQKLDAAPAADRELIALLQ